MTSNLWLPAKDRPTLRCRLCDRHFYEEKTLAKHIKGCAEDNRDKLAARRPVDIFEGTDDTEYIEWVRKHGRVR